MREAAGAPGAVAPERIVLASVHVRPTAQAVPLAAACLAAALPEEVRHRVRLIDGHADQDEGHLFASILSAEPELVAFSLYVWNRERILSLGRRLKQAKPGIFLAVGGPEAGTDAPALLAEGFDAVIRGEGEEPFRMLVDALLIGKRPPQTSGLLLQGGAEEPSGKKMPPPRPLDDWPSPWLSGVLEPEKGGGVLWELSRGCPFACDFCYDGRGRSGVRHIAVDRMEAELDLFIAAGVAQVWVLDSTFNYPPERGKVLLRLIERKRASIHFHFEAKADFLDREMVRLLSRIPCSVQIGLQSARPEVLANIHRAFDPRDFAEKMHLLASEGVTFGIDLIYGLPGDDYPGFARSLDTALAYAPNHLDIFPLAVLPGTPLHREEARFGIRSDPRPPYLLLSSDSCDADGMLRCRLLGAAADLFYNLGRAVGFFPALTQAVGQSPAAFLEGFAEWAMDVKGVSEAHFLDPEAWEESAILDLQEGYVRHLFDREGCPALLPAALDLIRYHFHHAEALLRPDLIPAPRRAWEGCDLLAGRWRRAPDLELVAFSYEILDMEAMGEVDLEEFAELFRPVGSLGLFFRRGGEVFCESLEEDFARLLRGSDGSRRAEEVFGGAVSRQVAEEIVEFALAEGFLLPKE